MLTCWHDGRGAPTSVADERDRRALLGDAVDALGGRAGAVPAGSLHGGGARDAGAPLAGGAVPRPGTPLPRGGAEDGRLDDDRDARRAVAEARRGGLPAGARQAAPEAPFEQPLKIAIPAKGRLREPAVGLLHDAGLGPEEPGERALAFPCRNAPVEVLLVRAADIPEYVQDGVVDCGITGADLVLERGARVSELLRLGFGACTLQAAVPTESVIESVAELAGRRVATVYPGLTRTLLT